MDSTARTLGAVLVQVLIRTLVLAGGILAYDVVYDRLVPPTPGDADIGKGLLAFFLIMCASGAWGIVDGLRHAPYVWAVVWVVTGLLVSFGWDLSVSDGSRSLSDLEPALDLFLVQLVAAPAAVGAGLGWLVGGRDRATTRAHRPVAS